MRIRDLRVTARGRDLLHSINLTLERGENLAILGLNGAGKTTLLKALARLIPYRGLIEIDGKDASRKSCREMARRLSYLPQRPQTPDDLSAFDFVLMGVTPYLSFLEHPGPKHRREAANALEHCGVTSLRDRPVALLSGGEQQMVFLARALVQKSPFLLLDEPFAHLDFCAAYAAADRITSFIRNDRLAAVVTVHDPNLALAFADKILVLHQGVVLDRVNTRKKGFLKAYQRALNRIFDNGVEMLFHKGRPLVTVRDSKSG